MTHKEIFEALLAGKKITLENSTYHCYLKKGNLVWGCGEPADLNLLVHTYSIYEEPKKYQVLFTMPDQGDNLVYSITTGKYSSEEDFYMVHKAFPHEAKFVKLLVDD